MTASYNNMILQDHNVVADKEVNKIIKGRNVYFMTSSLVQRSLVNCGGFFMAKKHIAAITAHIPPGPIAH